MSKKTSVILKAGAFLGFMFQLGTVGALECDNIGFKQALTQLLIFGMVTWVCASKGGLFSDNA